MHKGAKFRLPLVHRSQGNNCSAHILSERSLFVKPTLAAQTLPQPGARGKYSARSVDHRSTGRGRCVQKQKPLDKRRGNGYNKNREIAISGSLSKVLVFDNRPLVEIGAVVAFYVMPLLQAHNPWLQRESTRRTRSIPCYHLPGRSFLPLWESKPPTVFDRPLCMEHHNTII